MLQTNNGERLTVILVDSSDVIFLGLGGGRRFSRGTFSE